MPKTIIAEGKTTTEAIENGLKQLNTHKSMVDIKVVEEEKKSFFSILAPRVVKVQLTLKEEKTTDVIKDEKRKVNENEEEIKKSVEKLKLFVADFIEKQPVKGIEWEVKQNKFDIEVNVNGNNEISYRGETLNALQTIISSVVNKDNLEKIRVYLDINGYRQKRIKTLEDLALKVSKTVLRTGKPIALEPMTAYERKIIHSALQGNTKVTTFSKGEEPYRKIVIDINKNN